MLVLLNTGCNTTVKNDAKPLQDNPDKYSIYRDMALGNLKTICLTKQGHSCWGLSEKECISNFIHYQNICSLEILNGFPIYPAKNEKVILSGKIGGCVFKKRIEHNYNMDKINMKSCQDMRLYGKQLFNEGNRRFNEVSSTNKELQKWINAN